MATYTTNSGIKKTATGDESGTWGTSTNTNFDIIDRVAAGVGDITLSGTTHTLTTSDGSASDGQYHVLVLGGSPSGTNTITVSPNDAKRMYFVKNNSGQSAIFSQGSGANVTVEGTDTGASSNVDGSFSISGLGDGTYTVTASYIGFNDATATVTVSGGQSATADLILEKSNLDQEKKDMWDD